MTLKFILVHDWRRVWSWWSTKAAVLLVLLGAVQISAQTVEDNTAFAAMTHSSWWLIAKMLIAAAIPLLSVIRQPAAIASAASSLPAPAAAPPLPTTTPETSMTSPVAFHDLMTQLFNPKGNTMNQVFENSLRGILPIVLQAEAVFKAPGSGVDKAAAVTGIVAANLQPGDSAGMQKAQGYMEMAVWALRMFPAIKAAFMSPTATTTAAAALPNGGVPG